MIKSQYFCDFCGNELHNGQWDKLELTSRREGHLGEYVGIYCDYDCVRQEFDRIMDGQHPGGPFDPFRATLKKILS